MKYKAIVIGCSAGGFVALKELLTPLRKDFSIPIIIVQHISPHSDNYITTYLNEHCNLNVKEADQKEIIQKGNIYFAPPNFHLLIEENFFFSLTTEERINFARPAINILFETASYAYKDKLIGIILTGANNDGSKGMKAIKKQGGLTIVQNPETAEVDSMPLNAINATKIDYILDLKQITEMLNALK